MDAKEKKQIPLYNRYGAKIWLEHLYNNKYILKSEKESDLMYMRCGGFEGETEITDNYSFIDPSGGPFLSVGGTLTVGVNKTVTITEIVSEKNDETEKYVFIITVKE